MGELERNCPVQLRSHHMGLLKAERIHEPVQVTGITGRRQFEAFKRLAGLPKPAQVHGHNPVFASQERHSAIPYTGALGDPVDQEDCLRGGPGFGEAVALIVHPQGIVNSYGWHQLPFCFVPYPYTPPTPWWSSLPDGASDGLDSRDTGW